MGGNERYQIRKAAGVYWLLDMEQSGIEGRGCVMLNESGALIWNLYARLGSVREVARPRRMSDSFCSSLRNRESFLKSDGSKRNYGCFTDRKHK